VVPFILLSLLLLGLVFEIFRILSLIIGLGLISEHVCDYPVRVILWVHTVFLCLFIVVGFDLFIQSLLHLMRQHSFLLILIHLFDIFLFRLHYGSLVNQSMLELSFSSDFLHVQLLIVLINLRILAIVLAVAVAVSIPISE
jgi:hypothetical protein